MRTFLLAVLLFSTVGVADMTDKKLEQMLYTATLLTSNGGGGSGVVVYAGDGYSLIVTAQHVIRDVQDGELFVALYPQEKEYPAKVVKTSTEYDLALVRIEVEHDYVAKRALAKLNVFDHVYKVGSGLGGNPFPTEGIISSVGDYVFQASSPIIFGDSGGGIFIRIKNDYYLVGLVISVAVARLGPFPNVVPHMANCYDAFALEDFFKAEQ